ncbi:MAG: tRNA 4-thiouridine(8) synthase ThiI, partial [Candidatus Aenigmatarchaeota archaeon]
MFLALVSGGIDSPVAAKLAGKRERIELLHFNLYPYYCQGAFELVLQALKKLGKYAWIVPWGEFLREAIRSRGYQCLICRAGMYWVGSRLAKRLGCRGLVTGESLGQKASQTLKNLWAVSGFSCLPVLR